MRRFFDTKKPPHGGLRTTGRSLGWLERPKGALQPYGGEACEVGHACPTGGTQLYEREPLLLRLVRRTHIISLVQARIRPSDFVTPLDCGESLGHRGPEQASVALGVGGTEGNLRRPKL